MTNVRVKTALLSVSDKSNLLDLAAALKRHEVNLLSTGGTCRQLDENGYQVTEVSEYTGSPEMMGGRVKTLHPKVHGGLLGRRGVDTQAMSDQGIRDIDLLVVNLYPFEQAVADRPTDLANAIENIDIGGPAMLRSAAKNHESVAVVVDASDYASIAEEMDANDALLRRRGSGWPSRHSNSWQDMTLPLRTTSQGLIAKPWRPSNIRAR